MRTSVSLPDELTSYVGEVSESVGENNAEAIRETIRHAIDLEDRVDDLEERVDELEDENEELATDVERLQNEKQQILEQREEHTELVRQVERERTLEERWRSAGLGTRLKWRVFGMDDEE